MPIIRKAGPFDRSGFVVKLPTRYKIILAVLLPILLSVTFGVIYFQWPLSLLIACATTIAVALFSLRFTLNKETTQTKDRAGRDHENQMLAKDMEIQLLQAQMNPHFLFNTLVTIGYKARLSNDETVYRMLAALTELLQAGIQSSSHGKITIRQELEFIRLYLYLQQERFGDKIEYSIHVEDNNVLDLLLPKLSIEPVVENAVIHGLEKKLGKGTLKLIIREKNGSIYVEVTDNGAGFENGGLLREMYESDPIGKPGHNNIGLFNTNRRIKLIYGEPYGISIESTTGSGSRVTIHIPADRGEAAYV